MFWHHKVLARPDTKEYWRGVYKRMRDFLSGRTFTTEKVFESEDETEALLHEAKLISDYGFNNLVNTQTHAFTGRRLKADARKVMSKSRRKYVAKLQRERGYKMPPSVRRKISIAGTGRIVSLESSRKISAAKKGVSFTADHRKALSLAAIKRKPRSARDERKRLKALREVLCGKPKDTTKARLSRSLAVYSLCSPSGEQWYVFSHGLLRLLRAAGLSRTTFYRALKSGQAAGWRVVKA